MKKPDQEQAFVLAATLVYFTTWLTVLSSLFEPRLLGPALLVATVYAGLMYHAMAVRKRIAFSADTTAIPAVFALTLAGAAAAWFAGTDTALILGFLWNVPKAWLLGHAVMFVLVFIASKLGLGGQ